MRTIPTMKRLSEHVKKQVVKVCHAFVNSLKVSRQVHHPKPNEFSRHVVVAPPAPHADESAHHPSRGRGPQSSVQGVRNFQNPNTPQIGTTDPSNASELGTPFP